MKWKLNIRKEIKVGVALVGISLLIAFSEHKQSGVLCNNIVIELNNVQENHFMDEAEVLKLVETSSPALKGTPIEKMNLKEIERKLKYDKHILDAELYGDLKGNLIVNVELRRPLARIVQEDDQNAYIAEDGTIMPISEKFTSRVMLLSGSFVKKLLEYENLNDTEEGRSFMNMIRFIDRDSFWKAQIAQLEINAEGKVFIYPQVTSQQVEFGKPDNIEMKFKKLMIFYKEILPQRGWTRYRRVNLEYEDQVIAE